MNTYFDYKHSLRTINFHYTRKPTIDEREIHSYHEILYYIGGDATLLCESFSKELKPNSLILIPKESYHFFKCDDPGCFERLKISFAHIEGFEGLVGCIMDGIHIFDQLDTKITALLDDVCQALEDSSGGDDASAFLSGALLILLSSLGKGGVSAPHTSKHMLITFAVSYIDKNLSKDLNVKIVADAMKVSQSTLSHTFKSEMGISLHKYIIEKRMILAKRLIDGGGSPTKIFSDLGFSDYSSFYKAFVTYFGYSPSGKGI